MASTVSTHNTTWVTNHTWNTGDPLTASDMNTYIRDQLAALKSPASFRCWVDDGADYSITATSFTNIDGTDLYASITTGGGGILVGFTLSGLAPGANRLQIDVIVDGVTLQGTNDGIFETSTTTESCIGGVIYIPALSAGTHNFALQAKVSGGTATIYAGAGTSARDTHPIFWGSELVA